MHNNYLDFKEANCKNCYKCLHECPVKAITVLNDQARIRDELCVLCGHCANVCRFNAKQVVDDKAAVKTLIASKKKVIVSLAPAFAASFVPDFSVVNKALQQLGFSYAEETARGAHSVSAEYKNLLEGGKFKNLIASACPALVRLIQIYHPKALKYLAMVDSPMVAHAKLLKKENPTAAIVFVGPCIAKKREADESGVVDAVLTFEELKEMLDEANINLANIKADMADLAQPKNKARFYPINRGIIKSFDGFVNGYEYISVDGMARAAEVLENIESLSGMFIEMHACEFSCINGPCALNKSSGGFIKATETIRAYSNNGHQLEQKQLEKGDFTHIYKQVKDIRIMPPEYEIKKILEATGKRKPEDELDCGACGYNTCRDKAIAVYNKMAQLDMCVPYMRERAEGLSYDIIQNSPNGIFAVDANFVITEINEKGAQLLGTTKAAKGELLEKFYNPADFYLCMFGNEITDNKKVKIDKTGAWVEMSIRQVQNQDTLFCIMKDITAEENYYDKLSSIKADTIKTTDDVIEKQMRVVQEIAGLLGETAAETKIALIKLKKTLSEQH